MRWLLIGLLISVGALLYVAVAATRHVLRQRRAQAADTSVRRAGEEKPAESEQVAGNEPVDREDGSNGDDAKES